MKRLDIFWVEKKTIFDTEAVSSTKRIDGSMIIDILYSI